MIPKGKQKMPKWRKIAVYYKFTNLTNLACREPGGTFLQLKIMKASFWGLFRADLWELNFFLRIKIFRT